jgi:hypothetical protein
LSESVLYRDTVDGKDRLHIPLSFDTANHIENIVALTRDLLAMKPAQCVPSSKINERLQRALLLPPAELQAHFPKHRLHPYVDLFLQCASKEHLFDWRLVSNALSVTERTDYAKAVQQMLMALHAGAHDLEFRIRIKTHQDKVRRNLRVIRQYTDAQFRHSKVLVIRVDCLFAECFAPAHEWAKARNYRKALIKYLNRDLPKVIQPIKDRVANLKPEPISGYIIGTEYGLTTGWHFHVSLFLNGNRFENDVGIASRICWTWKNDIAHGDGRYYNCNAAARNGNYGQVGVGMIHRHDLVKRDILSNVVTIYGSKGCYFAEAQTKIKDRLLNKGGWPKAKDPRKGGRPESQQHTQPRLEIISKKQRRFFAARIPNEAAQPLVSH